MTSNPPDGQVPGTAPAACKRPGCGNPLPAQGRGRNRQFCGPGCARRYHNDARIPAPATAPPAADSPADPLAALEGVIRQAVVLIRAAREQAASLDPARVRAQIAEAEAARRRAEAAAAAARQEAGTAAAALEQARRDAAGHIAAARAETAGQVSAAQSEAGQAARERDEAIQAARRAETEASRARQAETDARAETDRVRADAARERDALGHQHQAQLEAVAALTAAERARAERAEQLLEAERADRRHLTSALTAPASPANGNGNGNGGLPKAAGKAGQP